MKKPRTASLYAGGVTLCAASRDRLRAVTRPRPFRAGRAGCNHRDGEATDRRHDHFTTPVPRRASLTALTHAVGVACLSLALRARAYAEPFAPHITGEHGVLKKLRQTFPTVGVALLVALLGVSPHLVFSLKMGELGYFKSAYDEEFYLDLALAGPIIPYRLISILLVRGLFFLSNADIELTLILADLLFPFLCTLSAGYLAHRLAFGVWPRVLIILCLLFGQELFSLGCASIWRNSLSSLREQFSPWGRLIVPDYYTSYFSLFRSPEPQVSFVILFAFLGFLARYVTSDRGEPSRRQLIILMFFNVCLPFTYIFISFPLMILEITFAVTLWFNGEKKAGSYIGVSFLCAGFISLFCWFLSPAMDTSPHLFSSRLPILTPSVLYGVVLLALFLIFKRRAVPNPHQLALSFISMSVPIILMNQQIVTGIMISTRDWERYINYPLLVFGVVLFLAAVRGGIKVPGRARQLLTVISVAYFTLLLFVGQVATFIKWYSQNELVVAQKRAILFASDIHLDKTKVVLEQPELAPLLSLKVNQPLQFVINYNDLFLSSPVSDMPPGGGVPSGESGHQENLFEFFARTGRTPSEVRVLLKREAMQRAGFYLGFLFSFKDYWHPSTDNRLVRQEQILKSIDLIAAAYAEYLATPKKSWAGATLFLSREEPDAIRSDPIWTNELVSQGMAGRNEASKVYAYLQRVRVSKLSQRASLVVASQER